MTALSNMNQIRIDQVEGEEYKITVFAESVPMSTYLVAFLVSDFNATENPTNPGNIFIQLCVNHSCIYRTESVI